MTEQEKIDLAVQKFLNEEGTLSEIRLLVKLPSTKPISDRLEELGYHMYNGAKASSVKNLKLAIEEYIAEYDNQPSATKIALKYNIGRLVLSSRLKSLGYQVINHLNKLLFDNTMFDCIDTEEKAYWLGFLYADGYIDASPLDPNKKAKYGFELSLKGDDYKHLEKFNVFMKHSRNIVKVSDTKCGDKIFTRCRWLVTNKHLWESLNSKGCTPRKSSILKFPDENIFSSPSLIRHFIRGYWDGDGCLSYCDSNHTRASINVVGTEDFLTTLKKYLPLHFDYQLISKQGTSAKTLNVEGKNAFELAKYLYSEATIYLDRKYAKYLEYCRLYEKSDRELGGNIGEDWDVNTEITEESNYSLVL